MLHLSSIMSEIVLRGRMGDEPVILQLANDPNPIAAIPVWMFAMIGVSLVSGLIAIGVEYRVERETRSSYSAARF